MSFNAERYEFINAIRVGNNGGITYVAAHEYEIHEYPDFIVVVDKITRRAAKVERTNIAYTGGKWVDPMPTIRKKNNLVDAAKAPNDGKV